MWRWLSRLAAFPSAYYETEHGDKVFCVHGTSGLSIRDYFAAAALQGMYANPREDYAATTREDKVLEAYRAADDMLAERSK